MLSYDTLALAAVAVLALAAGEGRIGPSLAFFLPLLQIVAGMAGLPGPGLIPILLALHLSGEQKNIVVN